MSCLFISLDYFVKETSYIVRQKICDYLEENKPIMEGLDTKFILDMENLNYITNMRNTSTWGGAIEIQAACNIWNLRINVSNYRDNNNKIIEFIPINGVIKESINIY